MQLCVYHWLKILPGNLLLNFKLTELLNLRLEKLKNEIVSFSDAAHDERQPDG